MLSLFLKKNSIMIIDKIVEQIQERTVNTNKVNSSENSQFLQEENKRKKYIFTRRRHEGDSNIKSIVKAISWRIVGTIDTIMISWLITGHFKMALSIGGIEVFTKIVLYYLHERIWLKIKF